MAVNSVITANAVYEENIIDEQNDPGNMEGGQIEPQAEVQQIIVGQNEPENDVNAMNEDEESLIPSRDSSDVELWIKVQEVIYRNMSESSFYSIVTSTLLGGTAAVVFGLFKDSAYKYYVLPFIMMFFCATYFLASYLESLSCNRQSNIFGNRKKRGIWNKLCPSPVRFTLKKYLRGIIKSICPTLKFMGRTMCACSIPSSASTPMAVSDDISLWLFMQATAVKKTSLINFGVSIISLVLSIVCCTLASIGILLNEELMIVTTFAFYFLGSFLYTFTESFSCFIQAAIIANIDIEEDFPSRLKRFFKFIAFNLNCFKTSLNESGYQSVQQFSPEHRPPGEPQEKEEAQVNVTYHSSVQL